MFSDLQALGSIIGGLGVLALAAFYIVVRWAPGETQSRKRQKEAQEAILRTERQMGEFCRRTKALEDQSVVAGNERRALQQTTANIESMMQTHTDAGNQALNGIDKKLDTLNGHIIDHLRDHGNSR